MEAEDAAMEEDVEGADVGAKLSEAGSLREESLLDSDVILPAQYFDMFRQTAHVDTGIHRLMLTLLEDGIRCWQEGIDSFSRRKSRLAFHDNEWIFGDVQDAVCVRDYLRGAGNRS
jgi:hypothetical protein